MTKLQKIKISVSLKRFHKNKNKILKLKKFTASTLVIIGLLIASYHAIIKIKHNIMIANASSIDAITEYQSKKIYGEMVDYDELVPTASIVQPLAEQALPALMPTVKERAKVEELIKNTFPKNYKLAIAIAKCESKLNHKAIGDTNTKYQSTGLFQIRELPQRMKFYNLTTEKLQDPTINILMAHIIYNHSGWYPWTCYSKGLYKKYL